MSVFMYVCLGVWSSERQKEFSIIKTKKSLVRLTPVCVDDQTVANFIRKFDKNAPTARIFRITFKIYQLKTIT